MHAKFTTPRKNGRNLYGSKELVNSWTFIVNTKRGLREPIKLRWWMANGRNAMRVHCSIWTHGNNISAAGYGYADGGGYHKESAALDSAIESAGITLSKHIDGYGENAMREAGEAIVRALGYRGKVSVISN